ncbi:MAG: 4Fe-4S binding protein, partial [Bacteroidaceae bacterium]|nr:4Fe-4S binding protein [Bacteroidaceae bacterium]
LDIVLLVGMMALVVWAAYRTRSRTVIYAMSVVSVLYFGFFRSGCVCSVGSIQNVVTALVNPDYHLPWYVLLLFLLPIVFALLFGRVFCAGVCPLGALQELVNIKNFRLARSVSVTLSVIPWVYLAFTILYAATRSQFLICRLDPFVGIFRLGGDLGMVTFGAVLLMMSVFIGRPFCQFLCPYGALLSVFSSLSWKQLEITEKGCINCALCGKSCPVDAIRAPQVSKTKEERRKGVNRIIFFAILLPLLTVAGAMLLGSQSDALSLAHKDIYLYELLLQQERLRVDASAGMAQPEMDVPL